MDHVTKVAEGQRGLVRHIEKINKRLGHPELPAVERQALQGELAKSSKLLDHAEEFISRRR